MICQKCGKTIEAGIKYCPYCGEKVDISISDNNRKSVIPGFRTNRIWKKIIAILGYIVLGLMFVGIAIPYDYGNGRDRMIQSISGIVSMSLLIVVPFVLITNFMGIRHKLPIFRRRKFLYTIFGCFCVYILISLGIAGVDSIANKLYSEEYFSDMMLAEEKHAQQEAEQKKEEQEVEKAAKEKAAKEKAAKEKAAKEKAAKEKAAKEKAAKEKAAKEKAAKEKAAKEKAAEEKVAKAKEPENHVSKEYVRWFAQKYKLNINDFKSERVKVDVLVKNMDFSKGVGVEQSILSKRYERTRTGSILYIGDMKDNKPEGYGILFERVYACLEDGFLQISDTRRVGETEYENAFYTPIYAGEFRDGKFDGFGYKYMTAKEMAKNVVEVYDEPYFSIKPTKEISGTYEEIQNVVIDEASPCIYEGYFSKGKYNGKGNEYVYGITAHYGGLWRDELLDGVCIEQQYQEIFDSQDMDNSNEESQIGMIMGVMNTTPNLNYLNILSGTYKNGKANGKFHIYGNDSLIYEGDVKNDSRSGQGISYFYRTSQIEYDGEWRNGEYHGKGTLYRRDGSIEYDGKWANGDYAT